jgi:prolipoprotein diacylglyceryltransferase
MEVISAIYWDVIKGFDIGPLTIRWYGILFAFGVCSKLSDYVFNIQKRRQNPERT